MYRIGTLTKTLTFNISESLTAVSEYYAEGDTVSKLVFKTSQSRELDCADDSAAADLKLRNNHAASTGQMVSQVVQLSDGTITTVKFINQ